MLTTSVVRVATTNNFNCTPKEWKQLIKFTVENPGNFFFINSNIRTPKLTTVLDYNFKVVVTANPDLVFSSQSEIISKLTKIKSRIAFVRVKYLPNNKPINNLMKALIKKNIPIVITMQRFNSEKTLLKYTNKSFYSFSCSRFRLSGTELKKLEAFVQEQQNAGLPVWICDQSGKGCAGCGLCAKLTVGINYPVKSLNLSSSGVCPYNCPDCYAKTMQHFCVSMGHNPIQFNVIQKNMKQAGKTKHIQNKNSV